MNELERRYELKARELGVRIREKERNLIALTSTRREIQLKYDAAKIRFENLRQNLKSIEPSDKPKVSFAAAVRTSKEIRCVEKSLLDNTKDLARLKAAEIKEIKDLKDKKIAFEVISEKKLEAVKEKLARFEGLENDSITEDYTFHKIREGELKVISKGPDPISPEESRNNKGSSDHKGDTSPKKKVAPQAAPPTHTLSIDTTSKSGSPIKISVQDGGALSVSVLTSTERDKASLIRERKKLLTDLASLGVPLGTLSIRKRGRDL